MEKKKHILNHEVRRHEKLEEVLLKEKKELVTPLI